MAYHNRTKHSYESVRADRHTLDWANQPRPYKLYRDDLPSIALPRTLPGSHVDALTAIRGDVAIDEARPMDLPLLATLLHHTAGVTKRLGFAWGSMDFRAAACTGALYHIELYVVCRGIDGLGAGVYQFAVHDFSLKQLREGDLRGALVEAAAGDEAVARAPVTVVATSTYWRNSWKYQERTYRHCFWDLGTCLANLLAVASAHTLSARVVLGFDDAAVNRLIDVDPDREAGLALIPLGHDEDPAPSAAPIGPLNLSTVPLSAHERHYPAIREMHAASSLASAEAVEAWRARLAGGPLSVGEAAAGTLGRPSGTRTSAVSSGGPSGTSERDRTTATIEEVIRKRGSSRRFQRTPIERDQLDALLSCARRPIPADFLAGTGLELNDLYLIVNAVDGLDSGAYAFDARAESLVLLRAGDSRQRAAYLALMQDLAGDAAVNFYFLADLERVLQRLGNRGYRAAQLEASITAGRLYLAAYALGLGASGLTFFDDEVTEFFSPHAAGKSVMFLLTVGHPQRRRVE